VQRMGGLLGCGCERTGTVTVRKHNTGLVEWGYACKCGKTFKVHGSWDGKQPTEKLRDDDEQTAKGTRL
jgi:hypothetical protein